VVVDARGSGDLIAAEECFGGHTGDDDRGSAGSDGRGRGGVGRGGGGDGGAVPVAVARGEIVGPGVGGRVRRVGAGGDLPHVAAGHDNLVIRVVAIFGVAVRALRESGGGFERGILEGRVGLVDTGIDDADLHARAGGGLPSERGPGGGCVHQGRGAIE